MLNWIRPALAGTALVIGLGLAAPVLAQEAGTQVLKVPQEEAVARQVVASAPMRKALDYVNASDNETVAEWISLCNAHGP